MLNRQRVLNNLGFMENAAGIVAVILLLFFSDLEGKIQCG